MEPVSYNLNLKWMQRAFAGDEKENKIRKKDLVNTILTVFRFSKIKIYSLSRKNFTDIKPAFIL